MKIKILHTVSTIATFGYSSTFHAIKHKIEYSASPEGYIIDDKAFIPISFVKEITLEPVLIDIKPAKKVKSDKVGE